MSARALITGASGGIGLETAKLLAQAGYDVVLVARSMAKLEQLALEIKDRFGVDAQPVALDLSQPQAAHALFAQMPECDVLVNNAGFANNGRFASLPQSEIGEELRTGRRHAHGSLPPLSAGDAAQESREDS